MKKHLYSIVALSVFALFSVPAVAGYWFNSADEVWRTSSGECVRTGYWTADAIIVGCDGKVAAPEVQAAPAVVSPPVAPAVNSASVGFDFDRADLNAAAVTTLDVLVDGVKVRALTLTGHADRIGTEDYNLDLSLRRASAVADYLAAQRGIDPQKMEIRGKGESEPRVACEGVFGAEAVRCLAPNRRVDVVVDLF